MSKLSSAAHAWRHQKKVEKGATVTIIDVASGMGASRRTAVVHLVADAAEVTVNGESALVMEWLCGGSTVDGVTMDDESVECVQCRLAAAVPQTPCVYFAWGEHDELLYVGSTINAPQRIRAHSTQTRWWPEVRRLTFEEHETEHDARRGEYEHITKTPGVHNKESRRGRFAGGDASVLSLVDRGAS